MITVASHFQPSPSETANRLATEETGATATEYSVLTGFIALAITLGVGAFGTALNSYFTELVTGVKTALGIP